MNHTLDAAPVVATSLDGLHTAIVGINYAPEPTGIAPYTRLMAEALADAGARVDVITGIPHYPSWRVPPEYRRGVRWREYRGGVQITRHRHFVPARPSAKGRAVLEASFLANSGWSVLRSRADAIIAVTPSLSGLAAAIAGRRGRPVGVIVQDLVGNAAAQSGTTSAGTGGRLAKAEYKLLASADLVGVITPDFRPALERGGVDPERIVELPNCIHVQAWEGTKEEARQALGWPQEAFIVAYTGSLGRKQGLEVAIGAARELADAGDPILFMIVGDGGELPALRERAAGLSNVRFIPPVSDALYPGVLAAADVLLLTERPGVTEMSLPSKLTSYAAAGRPIVASVAEGGITARLLCELGCAEVTVSGDLAALARSVRRLAVDDGARVALAHRACLLARPELSKEAAEHRYGHFAARLLTAPS